MRQIPYGQINFESIIKDNCIYVDKTQYIEKLESSPNLKTTFYLRPGRFGKSLFTNMLDYYYAIDKADKFDELFNNLYIKKHPTENKNNYYILNFDFSGIDGNENWDIDRLMESFNTKVISGIIKFIERYDIKFDIDKTQTPAGLIGMLFDTFEGLKLGNKIYIIIDEYDNFTNGMLKGNAEKFLAMISGEGFIKGFYARIKEAIKAGVVERFFATGIAPLTLDSMTTGFNIATDITRNPLFTAMVGFTEQEVKEIVKEAIPEKTEIEQQEIYDTMKKYYDGYRFSEQSEQHTFNSTLVMYYLNNYKQLGTPPAELLDMNIAANFTKLGNLLSLKGNSISKHILTKAIQNQPMQGNIINKFELTEMPTDERVIQSLLFYFGYLTIGENVTNTIIKYKIPNQVMSGIYNEYFLYLIQQSGVKINVAKIQEAAIELAFEGRINKICNIVEEYLSYVGNIAWQRYDEKYVQSYMHAILGLNEMFNVYLEYNVQHNRYIDVAVFKRENSGIKYQAIIELKYIKKEEAKTEESKQKEIERKRKEALEEIQAYSQDTRLPQENMKKFIVIYVGEKLELLEEIKSI